MPRQLTTEEQSAYAELARAAARLREAQAAARTEGRTKVKPRKTHNGRKASNQ